MPDTTVDARGRRRGRPYGATFDLPGSFEDNATIVADPVDGEGYYPAGTQSFSCVIDCVRPVA